MVLMILNRNLNNYKCKSSFYLLLYESLWLIKILHENLWSIVKTIKVSVLTQINKKEKVRKNSPSENPL
jgi:hypothetical protein